LLTHFAETFHLLAPADFPILRRQPGDPNLWRRYSQVIYTLDSVKPTDKRCGWIAEQVTHYNAECLDDLVSTDWDLAIFDEAYRPAGSDAQVDRYQLARALADAASLVLLLSATPHSGKTEAFRRLLSLLDAQVFPPLASRKTVGINEYQSALPARVSASRVCRSRVGWCSRISCTTSSGRTRPPRV
jgi:hypothetical protein